MRRREENGDLAKLEMKEVRCHVTHRGCGWNGQGVRVDAFWDEIGGLCCQSPRV